MDPINIAWFAGIFEADGNARVNIRTNGTSHGCIMSVTMIQKDVIEMIKERTELGTVLGPYGPTSAGNETWRWHCTDQRELARICLAVYPMLGSYKAGQISSIADYLYDHLPRAKNCIECGIEYMPNPFRGAASRSTRCSSTCNSRAYRRKKREASKAK